MIAPNEYQLNLLNEAKLHLPEKYIEKYLELKRLLTEKTTDSQEKFRQSYASFYGLNVGGVTEEFKNRYFDLLFNLELSEDGEPYTTILKDLYYFPRRQGDKALQCSFVSKLVAIHDETYPIFDSHVGAFFGVMVPPSYYDNDFRISVFVTILTRLRETYRCWSADNRFQDILSRVKHDHPSLKDCADSRIADFLVVTVGQMKSGKTSIDTENSSVLSI